MAKRLCLLLCLMALPLLSLVLFAGCGSTATPAERAAAKDPAIVAVYDGEMLTMDRFEEEYARSVGGRSAAQDDSLQQYEDFLQRYVDFRLKVREGQRAGYFDDPAIQAEIDGYRASFAKPYLLDKTVINPIVDLLYERSQEMVDVSHLLLRVPPDASPSDTLAAYTKITALRDSALQGIDFGALAVRHSEDPSAQRTDGQPGARGRLSYFSAGRMVEAFENQAYSTPVGDVSPVFRTQFGYHILFVHDRIPAVPDIRVSHLMVRPEGATPEDSARAMEQIKSLKVRIEAGKSMRTLAKSFSDDRQSAENGGDLGFLRFDNYQVDSTFRAVAFSMDSLNTVSDVVETPFGYHLLMITERRALGTRDEEYERLKQTASRLPRTDLAAKQLAIDIRTRNGAMLDTTAVYDLLRPAGIDSLMIKLAGEMFPDSVLSRTIASIGDTSYTVRDLGAFSLRNKVTRARFLDTQIQVLLDAFMDEMALAYESGALEQRDDEFRRLMREFRDGLVLFRLMEDSVWSTAQQDSAALLAHFEANASSYQYPTRTRIIELATPSDSLIRATMTRIDEGGLTLATLAEELRQDTSLAMSIDTLLVEGPTDSIYDRALALSKGEHTSILPFRVGRLVLFHDGDVPPTQKTYQQARPAVVNDYQQEVEERLVERLRTRYGARTFPERLGRAFTGGSPAGGPTASTSAN